MAGKIYQDNISWAHINASAYEVGMAFHVTTEITVTGLEWFRYQTGTQTAPEIVRLWRDSDTTELARLTSVPDDGTVAWQAADLDTPIVLSASTVYIVAAYFPGTGGQPSRSTPGVPTSPVALETNFRRYLSGSSGFPTSADAGSYIGVDILTAPAGGGGGGGATPADLEAWLSNDSDLNTHQSDGLPWQTDANVTTLKGEAEGSSGFAAIKAVADAIATAVSGLPGTIASAVTTITGQLTAMTGTMFDTGIATIGSISHDMQLVMSDALHAFTGLAGGAPGALSGRTAFPTELWTMVAETDFTFQISWDQSADLYTIALSGIPSRVNTIDVDGATWRPRVGWWALRNGDLLGARRFLSWENEYVEDAGRRMPGIVLRTQPEVTGHIQAWQLT
jgi:hypothetical protein